MSVAHSLTHEFLDLRSLREIAGADVQFVRRVLDLFASSMPLHLAELRESLRAGDLSTAQRIAHHIKGSSRSMGAGPMAEWAQRLENSFMSSSVEEHLSMLVELESVCDQTLAAMRGEA
jgi:HPt (histidine-containing phosphotransfer) domain-containing protein